MLNLSKILGKIVIKDIPDSLKCKGFTSEILNQLADIFSVEFPPNNKYDFVYYSGEGDTPAPEDANKIWFVKNSLGFDVRRENINGVWRETYPLGFQKWVEADSTVWVEDGWVIMDGSDPRVPNLSRLFLQKEGGGYTTFLVQFVGYSTI